MTNEELFDWCCKQNCKGDFNCDLCMYNKGRADMSEETYLKLITEIDLLNASDMTEVNLYKFACRVKEIAEQLKEQNNGINN